MKKKKTERKQRIAPRKETTPVHVSSMTALSDFTKILKSGEVVEASSSGLLILVRREDLVPLSLRRNLNLDALVGDNVFLRLADMNLEISGTVARTQLLGRKGYYIAVDYSDDAPEYWRECLMDLLPRPGELE